MNLPAELIQNLVRAALAEDVGGGDVTTEFTVPADRRGTAHIIAKEPCVIAGLPLAKAVFNELGARLTTLVLEGELTDTGQRICEITGPTRAILTGERTALNFLQRLSGVATLTRQFVATIAGTKAEILDTRKTTPTLRVLEKYAVAIGGGTNHRLGLFDAVMIKDNHRAILDARGSAALAEAVAAIRRQRPELPVIIEADTLTDVERAVAAGANHILLDNMTLDELRDAVELVAGRAKLEASGGVRVATVRQIAETGVDYISVGALTHSARAVDLSLEVLP
ncbi:MAG: Nicotinate-nucleotide pyrophosphorylase [carboxylating] [Verrucomicrobiae bacterium]|nr:Nicotinate-nucleotide pyrophosphorylase [carboxylating] [Verrucomicrobiae bacterium]